MDIKKISEMDRNSVLHPFTQLHDFVAGKAGDPTIVEGGKGIRIRDAEGREYIDGFAGRAYPIIIGVQIRVRRSWSSRHVVLASWRNSFFVKARKLSVHSSLNLSSARVASRPHRKATGQRSNRFWRNTMSC
jgi:hypothetical protein